MSLSKNLTDSFMSQNHGNTDINFRVMVLGTNIFPTTTLESPQTSFRHTIDFKSITRRIPITNFISVGCRAVASATISVSRTKRVASASQCLQLISMMGLPMWLRGGASSFLLDGVTHVEVLLNGADYASNCLEYRSSGILV